MSAKKNKKHTIAHSKTVVTTDNDIVNSDNPHKYSPALKEEILTYTLSVVCAIITYVASALAVQKVYHPDIDSLLASAKVLLMDTSTVRPEPMEALLFRLGVVIIIPGLIGFYILFSKMQAVKQLAQKHFFLFFTTFCALCIIAMIYFDFAAQNPYVNGGGEVPQNSRDFVGNTNFDFFFEGIFLGRYFLLYTFILVPVLSCLFFIGFKKYSWENNNLFKKIVSVIGYTVVGGIILVMILMNIFEYPFTFENKFNFNAAYYSMTQVFAGAPLLVNGFTNTYGLYPHFLNLIFHFTGLSVFKFSMAMSLLLATAFIFNFFFLKKYVNNKVIFFLGCCTVVCFPYFDFRLLTPFDSTFAFFPIRYIVPSTLVFLVTLYLNKKSITIYWVTFITMGILVLWNPEIGIISYLSWIAFNSYNDFFSKDGKIALKKILSHWVIGIGILIAVVYTYKGIIYLFYGAAPDLSLLYGTILVFGKVGFNLLPMFLIHPWNITALVNIFGFAYALISWYKKEITPKASVIFLLSIISLGFFVYFQGRSHNWPFACSTCFCIVLLTILGDELWAKIKNANILSLNVLFVAFLFVISFSFFDIVFNVDKFHELVYQEDDKAKQVDDQERFEVNTDFILKNSRAGEKIYMITPMQYQGLYFDGSKRISAFNPGEMDMFLKTDLMRLENLIIDSSFKIFIEPKSPPYPFLLSPLAAIAATYYAVDSTHSMVLLTKRKTKILSKSFLDQHDNIIHRKYNDDTGGINLRINDAFGLGFLTTAPEFSVELIFNPQPQIYQYATLIGNMNDSSGFVICNIVNTDNYFFGINGRGFTVPMPNNEWVYCVLNIFPDHIEVYDNDKLVGTLPLPAPIKQSPDQLFIGNGRYFRNYIGAISEVAVNKKIMDSKQIQSTWEEINKQ